MADAMNSRVQSCEKKSEVKPELVWPNIVAFAFLHLIWLYSCYITFSGKCKAITIMYFFVIGFIIGGLGITMGAHRLWSHRSFKAKLPLKLFLLLGQTLAGQNCVWIWARDHRAHHKFSDTDADPHNSNRGFFFSHMGWLMMKKHPEVLRKGKQIDMSDLDADPLIMFQKKYYILLHLISSLVTLVAVPYYFLNEDPWYSLMVGYVFRMVLNFHITWTVNSFAHMYGNKPYEKEIIAVQNPYVSFFALGEGWHNFHHAFPWDCNTSEFGQYFNLASRFLNLFAYLGLAYDLKIATKEMVMHRVMKHGDGSHSLSKHTEQLIK
ncbi:acyl-CoA Delta-9 desaturase [Halyomorpha halys]|uniref:acyl-CoA Delta-9 desaturase n=1 Tax=Halyomorpha halys TaxID=286706 RepID=UPI0006D4D417|nr:acyl-CoA desaturase 4-like [Halyomorpha halys]